ncbi:MAG: ATP-grasp domain-containing protein [Methyloprofundus sp.]|nr:ATP-grasp domain-containing protein [Methyloprofundus sp.]MBW6453581.1 ATP-grasp domain-containing protein [Methyloprofundus sp.]
MRLLVFEFITGGGFINQPLPQSLLQEGYLMRKALLDDLCLLNDLEILVLQDERVAFASEINNDYLNYLTIREGMDVRQLLSEQSSLYDTVWLIAPETEGMLTWWTQFFNQQGKQLCLSGQQAIDLCQDKLATSEHLQKAGIACVPSFLFDLNAVIEPGSWVLKANNSVGCDEVYLLQEERHWPKVLARLMPAHYYILQPYVAGKVLSLSCLFYQGQAFFICCNEQKMHIEHQQFVLSACRVNVQTENFQQYQQLCQSIATAIPQLFGYIGIDFIETEAGENLVLEINPRLTSSYAGINKATGLNIAELVLAMLDHKTPILNKTKNQSILVDIH